MTACRNLTFSLISYLAGIILLLAVLSTEVSAGALSMTELINSSSSCDGSIGECFPGNEFVMDSESSRRILASSNDYISNLALSKGSVPCSRTGASYYSNCRPGASANPYTRSCTEITKCQRDIN